MIPAGSISITAYFVKSHPPRDRGCDRVTLSTRTVETHRANIMLKLNLHSVTELLHFAFVNGLIEAGLEGQSWGLRRG
ncbi:MAG: LuxR C-terminal-related transcriptional regulator [Candidatus Acidiferrum sp.]